MGFEDRDVMVFDPDTKQEGTYEFEEPWVHECCDCGKKHLVMLTDNGNGTFTMVWFSECSGSDSSGG